MTECLRFLRVGVINVLGVMVPGILLIFLLMVGFVFPVIIAALPLGQVTVGSDATVSWERVGAVWSANKALLLFLAAVMGYVAGYVVRLSTPDSLDRISADMVLRKMDDEYSVDTHVPGARERPSVAEACRCGTAAAADHWPYRGEPGNKFPYYHFKDYLLWRGLNECAGFVAWASPEDAGSARRSKTHVHMMRLEVQAKSPELAGILESNEAHVRLMFGTWVAVKTCLPFVILGAGICIVGLAVTRYAEVEVSPPFVMALIVCSCLLVAMLWARTRIEHLFHYQRVRELLYIIGSIWCVRQLTKSDG